MSVDVREVVRLVRLRHPVSDATAAAAVRAGEDVLFREGTGIEFVDAVHAEFKKELKK